MKPTAYLINTSRGGTVDQVALARRWRPARSPAPALDVTDPEPLPADDPLLTAPNLVVVPHVGSATVRTRSRMADMAVDNLLAALAGRRDAAPRGMTAVAAVDIGTNSTRLLIADGHARARARVDRDPARRGRRPHGPARPTSRRQRVLDVLARFREQIGDARGAAVMTSAVRDAANGDAVRGRACATRSASPRGR